MKIEQTTKADRYAEKGNKSEIGNMYKALHLYTLSIIYLVHNQSLIKMQL